MGFSRRARAIVAVATVCALSPLASPSSAAVALPAVNGSGSTFAQIAIQQWTADVKSSQGLRINYQGNGSTAGRSQFAVQQVDFASSDVSYGFPNGLGDEVKPGFPYTYMPLVAGGTAVMYNLKDNAGRPVEDLQVTGKLLVRMLTEGYYEEIGEKPEMFWDDPAIVAENPHLAGRLPHIRVRAVVRKGGSGTTSVFTEYLYTQDRDTWGRYMQGKEPSNPKAEDCYSQICGPTDKWPENRGSLDFKDGSDGVANHVQSYPGTIGYAEYAYALQRGIAVARVKNVAGNYVLPTACNQAIALTRAERNQDGTYDLSRVYTHDHPSAYPISSYNYVIVPAGGSDPQKGETMGRFILYSITDGQRKAADLGYSPLPTNLIDQGFKALGNVPGHPPIPSNPAQWGQFYEQLQLPDGTRCGDAGENGGGGGGPDGGGGHKDGDGGGDGDGDGGDGDGGGGSGDDGGSGGDGPGGSGGPGGTTGPGAGGGPTANSLVSPSAAALAAKRVAEIAEGSGTPWGLYLAVLSIFGLVFLPAPIAGAVRRFRSGGRN